MLYNGCLAFILTFVIADEQFIIHNFQFTIRLTREPNYEL